MDMYITHVGSIVGPEDGKFITIVKNGVEKPLKEVFFFVSYEAHPNYFELSFASAKYEPPLYQGHQLESHKKLRKLAVPILITDNYISVFQDTEGTFYYKHSLGSVFLTFPKSAFKVEASP